jgi:ankyrin repeat protein
MPFHAAAAEGYKGPTELLLAHKAEVNANTNNGETSLHLAAYSAHKNLMILANDNAALPYSSSLPSVWCIWY